MRRIEINVLYYIDGIGKKPPKVWILAIFKRMLIYNMYNSAAALS